MTNTANPKQHESWNGDAGQRWVANADRHDHVFAPVTTVLLNAAALQEGEYVLDIGCGCGSSTMIAARTIGDAGKVTGVDISEPILDLAWSRAAASDVVHVEYIHADAQTHAFERASYDLAISRFGTMFFSDPVAAFANIATALRPGGRLCLATWQPLLTNEWLVVPGAALLAHAEMPAGDPNEPGMFAESDPIIIESILTAVGYADVECIATELELNFGSTIDAAVDYLAGTGAGRAMLETIPEGPALDAALADVRQALQPHLSHNGVHLNVGIWITTATRSARAPIK